MSEDLNVEGMTRGDFEQMFQDHTQRLVDVNETTRRELKSDIEKLDKKIDGVHADLSEKIDAIAERTNEDIVAFVKDHDRTKKTVATLIEKVGV